MLTCKSKSSNVHKLFDLCLHMTHFENNVQNASQFREAGCENCEDIMQMRGNVERVAECTSANFDG
jgi:hypothetical protein